MIDSPWYLRSCHPTVLPPFSSQEEKVQSPASSSQEAHSTCRVHVSVPSTDFQWLAFSLLSHLRIENGWLFNQNLNLLQEMRVQSKIIRLNMMQLASVTQRVATFSISPIYRKQTNLELSFASLKLLLP